MRHVFERVSDVSTKPRAIALPFVRPWMPIENAFIESFNGKF